MHDETCTYNISSKTLSLNICTTCQQSHCRGHGPNDDHSGKMLNSFRQNCLNPSSQQTQSPVSNEICDGSPLPWLLVMFNKILTPKFDIKSATLPNRKYGARVAQKKAMYESLTLESLSSMSTSSIEYSRRQEPSISRNPSSDFSDKVTPFCYTRNGYKTLADKDCQTEIADPEIDKVNTFCTDMDECYLFLTFLTGW